MTRGSGRLIAGVVILTSVMAAAAHAGDVSRMEASVEPTSGSLEATLRPPNTVRLGKRTKIVADIRNDSGVDLSDLVAYLHVDSTGLVIKGGPIARVRDLKAGATTRAAWGVRAGEVGSFVIVATVKGWTPGQHILEAEGEGVVLNVAPKGSP